MYELSFFSLFLAILINLKLVCIYKCMYPLQLSPVVLSRAIHKQRSNAYYRIAVYDERVNTRIAIVQNPRWERKARLSKTSSKKKKEEEENRKHLLNRRHPKISNLDEVGQRTISLKVVWEYIVVLYNRLIRIASRRTNC